MTFCINDVFGNKYAVTALRLLFSGFELKEELVQWCIDILERTVGKDLWKVRKVSTVQDGTNALNNARNMSTASVALGNILKLIGGDDCDACFDGVAGDGLLDAALGLDGVGLAEALGDDEFSDESPLAAWLDEIFDAIHGERTHGNVAPSQPFDGARLALAAQLLAVGTPSIRRRVLLALLVWANCRTGNTTQLRLLVDGVIDGFFDACWDDSQKLRELLLPLAAEVAALARVDAGLAELADAAAADADEDEDDEDDDGEDGAPAPAAIVARALVPDALARADARASLSGNQNFTAKSSLVDLHTGALIDLIKPLLAAGDAQAAPLDAALARIDALAPAPRVRAVGASLLDEPSPEALLLSSALEAACTDFGSADASAVLGAAHALHHSAMVANRAENQPAS